MPKSPSVRRVWLTVALTVSAAAVLAVGFTVLLDRYWAFYHLDTPGTGMGLLFFVLPGSCVLAISVSLMLARRRVLRGASVARATAAGLGAAGLVLVGLFVLEVWHSTAARSGEGAGAGDLAPFAWSLVGR